MLEITNSTGDILSFDGRVVELFGKSEDSKRVHARLVKNVEIKEGRKGDLEIRIQGHVAYFVLIKIDPSQRGAVEAFVAQVNSARG